MTYVILALIIGELYFGIRARSAIVGSRQRYVALSLRRVTSWAVNLAFLGEGVVALLTGQTGTALWYVIFGAVGLYLEVKTHKNDDDWFNGRGKKIRRGIRRALAASRPQGAAAPAFGMTAAPAS